MRFSTILALDTNDQQRVDPFARVAILVKVKENTGPWQPHKIGVRHRNRTAISQVQAKRPEFAAADQISNFLEHAKA